MAKKFVRGITEIKEISKQDFDTNNVNDLLSDGQYNYIHRKKGKSEEYHNLTDNIKTISSSNTDLMEVTNNNTTSNTATLNPKHDAQKEQVLESERNTITINHGTNGTSETTKVDTNPQKVLEHNNLTVDYGISKNTTGNKTKLGLQYTKVPDGFDFNTFENGLVKSVNPINAPQSNGRFFVSAFSEGSYVIQNAVKIDSSDNNKYSRLKTPSGWGEWREQVGDKSVIDSLLAQKQKKIVTNSSIGVIGEGLQQLVTWYREYNDDNGFLKTYTKEVSYNANLYKVREQFNFIVKINKGSQTATFTLNDHDKTTFGDIMTAYGQNNTVRISGCVFTLSGSTLTVSTANNTEQNYVTTFSAII